MEEFDRYLSKYQKLWLEEYCSSQFERIIKATETHTFYSSEGAWLTSFSIGPGACPQG